MNLPADERVEACDVDEKFPRDWKRKRVYTAFPRPQCEREEHVDQIMDILDRTRVLSHSHSCTEMGKDSGEELRTTIEIRVRKPSKRSKRNISELKHPKRNGESLALDKDELSVGGRGKIVLTYSFQHKSPKYGDSSTSIEMLLGAYDPEDYSRAQVVCFDFSDDIGYSRWGGEFGPILQALKTRMLDGAPGAKAHPMSDQQFMTLLVLLFLAHDEISSFDYHYKNSFAGYFANEDHNDESYS